jgi:hypothetical protein
MLEDAYLNFMAGIHMDPRKHLCTNELGRTRNVWSQKE